MFLPQIGPCSIVSRNKYGLGFMLIFLSILGCMAGKGMLFTQMMMNIGLDHYGLILCCGTCYLLPLIYVSTAINSDILTVKGFFAPYLPQFYYQLLPRNGIFNLSWIGRKEDGEVVNLLYQISIDILKL